MKKLRSQVGLYFEEFGPEKLLKAFQQDDLQEFNRLLKCGCNVNLDCGSSTYLHLPILGILAQESEKDCSSFTEAVLRYNVNINGLLPTKKCAIHHAVDMGNIRFLKILLNDFRTDVNALDRKNSTALHLLMNKDLSAEGTYLECLMEILHHRDIELNILDGCWLSPLHLAVQCGNKEAVKQLLKKNELLDLDTIPNKEGLTGKEAILKAFPDLEPIIPPPSKSLKIHSSFILYLLHRGDKDKFIKTFVREWNGIQLNYTFISKALSEAVKQNFPEVVEMLLTYGADPNAYVSMGANTRTSQ